MEELGFGKGKKYFDQQFTQATVETHEIACLSRDNVHELLAAYILCCFAHGGLDRLARSVHQQFREPFEDALDLGWLRALQVVGRERYADIVDAAGDFAVRLRR